METTNSDDEGEIKRNLISPRMDRKAAGNRISTTTLLNKITRVGSKGPIDNHGTKLHQLPPHITRELTTVGRERR
jgi:hypothetical protein